MAVSYAPDGKGGTTAALTESSTTYFFRSNDNGGTHGSPVRAYQMTAIGSAMAVLVTYKNGDTRTFIVPPDGSINIVTRSYSGGIGAVQACAANTGETTIGYGNVIIP